MPEHESAARAIEAMSPELLADLRRRSAGDSTRIALLAEIDRLNTVLDANRVVRNAAESSSRTYKGAMELLKAQRTQLRAELADARGAMAILRDGGKEQRTRAEQAEAERDEARVRLAELGEPVAQYGLQYGAMEPMVLGAQDEVAYYRQQRHAGLRVRDVYATQWRPAPETADATGTALSATETSELQFEASVPATKPEGAQRGAQGPCESERDNETGTER